MGEKRNTSEDYEYQIMEAVEASESINQRDLATSLGVSLGTINLLLSKMTKEGLIKIEKVSKRQVLYMLTPKGAFEKAQKTISYLKSHYQAINAMKENFKKHLDLAFKAYNHVVFCDINDAALTSTLEMAAEEYQKINKEAKISFGIHIKKIKSSDSVLCVYKDDGEETEKIKQLKPKVILIRLTQWM